MESSSNESVNIGKVIALNKVRQVKAINTLMGIVSGEPFQR